MFETCIQVSELQCCILSSYCTHLIFLLCMFVCLFLAWQPPQWAMASSFTRFIDHTQRHTTVGRTPLDEWSARSRDLYLTTHEWSARSRDLYLTTQNTHNKHTCPSVGFEPTISAGERPQTYALDRAATGTGIWNNMVWLIKHLLSSEINNVQWATPAWSQCLF